MHPKEISIAEFNYELPEYKIAFFPLAKRDESKLLIYKNGCITDDVFANAVNHLPADSIVVFNNTKVVEARLLFEKETGSIIEIFCLEPAASMDITVAMQQTKTATWKCYVGGARKWKSPVIIKQVYNSNESYQLEAEIVERTNDAFIIKFTWRNANKTFAEVLHDAGAIPLPPYIKRKAEQTDTERYQTVYAKHEGSVAAPTAGLHFTDELLDKLKQKQIKQLAVTLHVGAGTFKPVSAEKMEGHQMHAEFIDVDLNTIISLRDSLQKNVIAVGTTSVRTLESLYWLGTMIFNDPTISGENLFVDQWIAYENSSTITSSESLDHLINWLEKNHKKRLITKTSIIIAPGYTFRIVNALFTNFHQPQSSLLLLVAALIGDNWKSIYKHALNNNYRFLSYGDGSLLWGN
jgi:S-adenosylmethionine:tRNA ribosyltransferase-isomerase